MPTDAQRIEQLRAEIRRHDILYYVEARPQIPDRQYDALARLCVTLCRVLPGIRREFPRGPDGVVMPAVLPVGGDDFAGILGHYHLTRAKVDPGPAFDWTRLEERMRKLR